VGMFSSCLPKSSRNDYRTVAGYLPGSDVSPLERISEKTGRCKTHLIRDAVDSYLGSIAVQAKRGRQPRNNDG